VGACPLRVFRSQDCAADLVAVLRCARHHPAKRAVPDPTQAAVGFAAHVVGRIRTIGNERLRVLATARAMLMIHASSLLDSAIDRLKSVTPRWGVILKSLNFFSFLKTLMHKHPIEGSWTLQSREGQDHPAEALRIFRRDRYSWFDRGLAANALETGAYHMQHDRLTCTHRGGIDVYGFGVNMDELRIKRLEPSEGQLTVYRRARGRD
jgi:hypothetical protein